MEFVWKQQPITLEDGNVIEPKFDGHVTVKLPGYSERIKYMIDAKMKVDGEGNLVGETSELETILLAVKLAHKHIVEVALVCKENGQKISTSQELEYIKGGGDVLQSVGFVCLNGPN